MNFQVEFKEKPPLILLVDDILQNLQILHHILSNEGYSFALAGSGVETFSLLEKKLPDLILLDIMMNDMDGFEICKRLKANRETAGIPIIFLTARVRLEDKVKGFQLGAVDYITKPFEEAEVIVRVRTHLQLKRSSDMIKKYNEQLEKANRELLEKNQLILNQKEELEISLQRIQESQKELVEMEKKNAIMAMAITTNHELNQPLTVIQGYLELLKQSLPNAAMSEMQRKYLSRIDISYKRIIEIMEKFRNSPAAQLEEYARNKKIVIPSDN